jgi:predicted enzyme related to lactoylglutathione lyase
MVNLATDDIDRMHERLVATGAPVVRPPEPESWGGRVATYADPDGNLIQLLALPGT